MEAKGEGFEAIFTSNKDLFALKHSIEKNVFSVYIYVWGMRIIYLYTCAYIYTYIPENVSSFGYPDIDRYWN